MSLVCFATIRWIAKRSFPRHFVDTFVRCFVLVHVAICCFVFAWVSIRNILVAIRYVELVAVVVVVCDIVVRLITGIVNNRSVRSFGFLVRVCAISDRRSNVTWCLENAWLLCFSHNRCRRLAVARRPDHCPVSPRSCTRNRSILRARSIGDTRTIVKLPSRLNVMFLRFSDIGISIAPTLHRLTDITIVHVRVTRTFVCATLFRSRLVSVRSTRDVLCPDASS